jgi:5-formyltetrahydrofolate cyclo-ligase
LKQAVRERVWTLLETKRAARFPGTRGRIPNFVGAEAAADRLASLPEWQNAQVIKANPDAPQLPVRGRALKDGKRLYMAWPRLAGPKPFIVLDPRRLRHPLRHAASIKGAMAGGSPVAIGDMKHIDLVVCGSVAVNRKGARIGKGGGFSDIEFGLLGEAGLIDARTVLVTTVHPLQVVAGELPETGHDFRVDIIVTPDEVIRTRRSRRPSGIVWDDLDDKKIAAIPVLRRLSGRSIRPPRGGKQSAGKT